jgi:hypothetical protein
MKPPDENDIDSADESDATSADESEAQDESNQEDGSDANTGDEEPQDYYAEFEAWFKANWDTEHNMPKAEWKLRVENAELRRQLLEAEPSDETGESAKEEESDSLFARETWTVGVTEAVAPSKSISLYADRLEVKDGLLVFWGPNDRGEEQMYLSVPAAHWTHVASSADKGYLKFGPRPVPAPPRWWTSPVGVRRLLLAAWFCWIFYWALVVPWERTLRAVNPQIRALVTNSDLLDDELGYQVKKAFPGDYDDLSDSELGRRVRVSSSAKTAERYILALKLSLTRSIPDGAIFVLIILAPAGLFTAWNWIWTGFRLLPVDPKKPTAS